MSSTLLLIVLVAQVTATAPATKSAAPAVSPDSMRPAEPAAAPERGALPTSDRVREALGEAHTLLERERQEIREERRRLEQLRTEIRQELGAEKGAAPGQEQPGAQAPAVAKPGAVAPDSRQARLKRTGLSVATMEPAAAAIALSHMDTAAAVELLAVMDAKRVGKILEAMAPDRAAVLVIGLINKQGATVSQGKEKPE
jgi:flagellar motility protein MotE (MotC chaperone)